MTDLVIGEFYAWNNRRAKLLATGTVLKSYQRKGVQIEVPGQEKGTNYIYNVLARNLTSTWEDFTIAQEKLNDASLH